MKLLVQVCGDPTLDWLAVQNEGLDEKGGVYFWLSDQSIPKVNLSSQAGGSVLIYGLLKDMFRDDAEVVSSQIAPELMKEPMNDRITNSWTVWRAYVDKSRGKTSFRISEWQEYEHNIWDYESNRLTGKPDLLIIEDSGIGFRDATDGWPESISDEAVKQKTIPGHIILKLSQYNEKAKPNPLKDKIIKLGLGKRTTVVTPINNLRACPVKIGASLSWERIFDEVTDAVYSPECPFVDKKTNNLLFERVIVTIGTSGAVIVDRKGSTLVFDRAGQEDDFARKHQGSMMGYNTCVIGALAAEWVWHNAEVNWAEAVRDGIGLARLLDMDGYEVAEDGNRRRLQFPCEKIGKACRERRNRKYDKDSEKIWDLGIFKRTKTNAENTAPRKTWSILEETVRNGYKSGKGKNVSDTINAVCECAKLIVEKGPKTALPDIPIETVGGWRSADRQEIEGVRSVNNAFRNYLQQKKQETPLCVAVFGPPGAGKSFAIKEIAKGLGIEKDSQLTFNLSQFESHDELSNAFHQIRDLHLKGKTPLVFWDEFDTPCEGKLLGWLRYFLAPMQDGEFTDQGRIHPVSGGIYVFAGATKHSFDDFSSGSSPKELAAKKPDFISRLRAYIDVKGPNGSPNTIEDKLFIIRRAFLLNHFIGTYAGHISKGNSFQVEPGVLNAFLKVNRYRHGARSMETLVRMSNLMGKKRYELSSLPPDQVLRLHVNADEFLSLTRLGHLDPFRVGITGHIGLDPNDLDTIEKGVREAVAFIESRFPGSILTAFSPMALGADRLVARILLEKEGAELIAVLPVPKEDYINDFGKTDEHSVDYYGAEMRQEFRYWLNERATQVIEMSFSATRDEAYQKAGYFIAQYSDVLIAVWDGMAAQGKGGTAEIVDKAVERGKPVCHIWAGNYKSNPEKRTAVGAKLGTMRYINFPGDPKGVWIP